MIGLSLLHSFLPSPTKQDKRTWSLHHYLMQWPPSLITKKRGKETSRSCAKETSYSIKENPSKPGHLQWRNTSQQMNLLNWSTWYKHGPRSPHNSFEKHGSTTVDIFFLFFATSICHQVCCTFYDDYHLGSKGSKAGDARVGHFRGQCLAQKFLRGKVSTAKVGYPEFSHNTPPY